MLVRMISGLHGHGIAMQILLLTVMVTVVNSITIDELLVKFDDMKLTLHAVTRQMLMQQLYLDERVRSEADSGVKQVRHENGGTRNYYKASHSSAKSAIAIHDHSNYVDTAGIGEFVAVLNGIEFRTRHNDYRLKMPHETSSEVHETQSIPFPGVPPEVTHQPSVDAQVQEMREWFKAWSDQDHSVRDYRRYFKPILCYLEGAWFIKTEGKIDEPFESDRHFVDASSWFDLAEKIRFTSYSGRKDTLENYAYLPTAIMNVTHDGRPVLAQWNYRILCHPVSRDVPLNRLRAEEEVGLRMSASRTYTEHARTRAARFQLNSFDTDEWKDRKNRERWGLLDELMSEIPGLDNYQGELYDNEIHSEAFTINPKKPSDSRLRADRYHRCFRVADKDAMGSSERCRGYSDSALYMAMNTQPSVAGMNFKVCKKEKGSDEVCNLFNQKWSYAIPLEIIYLTPLNSWNPYDLEFKGKASSELGKTVVADGRNGDATLEKAFDGTNSGRYYQIPVSFFSGNEIGTGLADTTKNSVGVLDKKGNLRICKASGIRIFFPLIEGVGLLRQRYPIFPVHGEGSSVWKELNALKDLVVKSKTNAYVFQEPLSAGGESPVAPPEKDTRMQMTLSKSDKTTNHNHEFFVTKSQIKMMLDGAVIRVTTTKANSHQHILNLKWGSTAKKWVIVQCDDGTSDTQKTRCWDKHGTYPVVLFDEK